MLSELYRSQSARATVEMEALVCTEMPDVNVRRVILEGDTARQIVQFAHEEHADIIVMPTHGYGPFRRFILGSVTAKVLHDADCPVWTGVHLEQAPALRPIPLRNVLCAVDLGPQSSKALCWAALLAGEFGANLTVVHAATALPASAANEKSAPDLEDAAAQEVKRLLRFVGAEAEQIVEPGEAAKVICAAATRTSADVLIIGRGSAAGVFGRLRTNAYTIIRESPCPVVSV
jgi:nucleotide-binding universal stress UspA family protein